ncbi:MAG: hypothetical protein ACREQY_02215, partial [Candidatus Binatia bacterium]
VYVFREGTDGWTEEALLASGMSGFSRFGTAVALSGDTLVAGDPGYLNYSGAAYVFRRTDGGWNREALFVGGGPLSQFGYSVAISRDTAMVGAPFGGLGAGTAAMFIRAGSLWTQAGQLVGSFDGESEAALCHIFYPSTWDLFGVSIGLSPEIAVIGAPGDEGSPGAKNGAEYVYESFIPDLP